MCLPHQALTDVSVHVPLCPLSLSASYSLLLELLHLCTSARLLQLSLLAYANVILCVTEVQLKVVSGRVNFDKINFSYDDFKTTVLSDLSFEVHTLDLRLKGLDAGSRFRIQGV